VGFYQCSVTVMAATSAFRRTPMKRLMVKFGSAWPRLSATTAGSLGALQRLRAGEAGLSSDCEDSAVGTPHRGVLHGEAVTGQR
jgi:hypothetical protein